MTSETHRMKVVELKQKGSGIRTHTHPTIVISPDKNSNSLKQPSQQKSFQDSPAKLF